MKNTTDYNNLTEFINDIINLNIIQIIDDFETQSEKGFVFERLWDLIIKFGYCPNFPKSKFKHIISNVNSGKIKYLKNLQKYLTDNKIQSGNSGGCSDITLYDELNDKYIFITSKYPKSNDDTKKIKSKPVIYYDVQNILAIINENNNIYKNYEIFLLVPSKSNVLDVVKNANKSSEYITKYMTETNIFDKNDLEKYFSEFKKDILKYNFDEYNDIFMSKKDKLMMRFHQKLINYKTSLLIDSGEKQILWGCKCRSGKTFMTGGQILRLSEIKKNINILIITPAPTETTPQFTDDLFNSFIDFNNFNVHSISGSNMLKNLQIDENSNNIFIVSKQLMQKYTGDKKINTIKNIDIIFFDENHFSGTTEKSKNIIDTYSTKKTVKIFLTATYNKPLKEWNINDNCQMFWDIEDEQLCKAIYNDETELNKLIDKHGVNVNNIIDEFKHSGYTIKEIFEPYLSMPDLYLITSLFDPYRYDIIKENIKDSNYGFSFETLFSLNKSKTKFNFEIDVNTFLRYISGSNKEVDFKLKDMSIFSRIHNNCSEKESRLPFTQIWFLPPNNIDETSKALKKQMEKDSILSKYDIYSINSKSEDIEASEIKETIDKYEKDAKSENKRGLILLAGNMLSLGITLNKCDVVLLLNNTLSSDKVMQQMYRCMTEGKNKKIGFVVDLNISRVLNTCINYSIYKKDLSLEEKTKYLIDYHLINIDVDMWDNKQLDSDKLVKKLLDIWKNDPINNLRTMLRNLDNEYIDFDNDTQKLLNKSFTSSSNDKMTATVEFKDENDDSQSIQSGKEITSTESDNKELNEMEKDLLEEEKKEKEISFTKDVLPFIIPLTCILTMSDTNKDFIKMLSDIQHNPELLEVFNEQSLIWWNKNDLIKIIKNIVEKYINKNSNTFNISINFKMGLKSLIDKPKELLELINECLKPKEIEKNKFGEVFTPMYLINEKLEKLDEEYKKIYKMSIFTNKKLKWLDPATGMGNYPIAVYLKLFEGLKNEIPDDKKRKKHILEKMLYMCEINKKNCYIVKQIFNINNEYNLNLYEGDFLKFESNKKFGIEKYDIIMGNPPYNKSKETSLKGGYGGRSLWDLFVVKSLDELLNDNGFLMFIHPPSWRKPEHYLWNILSKKQILYLKCYSKKEGNQIFKCSTLVDYYVIENKNKYKNTIITGQDKKDYIVDLDKWNFLPSAMFDDIEKILGKNEVIYSSSIYDTRRPYISKNKTKEFNLPIIHNMTKKDGLGFVYSKEDKGQFGISKVILSFGEFQYPYNDWEGKYGMSQICYGLKINSKDEGDKIVEAINTDKFKNILKYTKWSTFQTDWRMFKYFKKDFYKYFIEKNDIVIKRSISNKIEKDLDSEEEKPKINKVKKNKNTMNKTK